MWLSATFLWAVVRFLHISSVYLCSGLFEVHLWSHQQQWDHHSSTIIGVYCPNRAYFTAFFGQCLPALWGLNLNTRKFKAVQTYVCRTSFKKLEFSLRLKSVSYYVSSHRLLMLPILTSEEATLEVRHKPPTLYMYDSVFSSGLTLSYDNLRNCRCRLYFACYVCLVWYTTVRSCANNTRDSHFSSCGTRYSFGMLARFVARKRNI